MEILLTEWFRDWNSNEPQELKPARLPLEGPIIFGLVVSLGNGNFDEACMEFDSVDAKQAMVGMLTDTGGAIRIEPDAKARACRLYKEGYEIYRQSDFAYFFLGPEPRTELFNASSLDAYIAEFKEEQAPLAAPGTDE